MVAVVFLTLFAVEGIRLAVGRRQGVLFTYPLGFYDGIKLRGACIGGRWLGRFPPSMGGLGVVCVGSWSLVLVVARPPWGAER
ncbi:MAG: hypothetical protein ACP5J3_02305 [Pyrobaculum sp.]